MQLTGETQLLNAMEPIVHSIFEEHVLPNRALKCDCDKCKLDIIVLTLNHVKPHYTSTQVGEAYIKALYMNTQMISDVIQELARSVLIVEQKPNH